MIVDPGSMDKRIKIMRCTATQDADGYTGRELKTVCECWASFNRMSGTEVYKAGGDFAEVKARFLIHYRSGIDRKMIVLYGGHYYEIQYVNDYGDRREYIELIAELVTPEADI